MMKATITHTRVHVMSPIDPTPHIRLALKDRTVRCVAFDPDDLLWRGVCAEDGPDSLKPNGQMELQAYLNELMASGIALAVVSRSEMDDALLAFDTHPGMVLGRSDIQVVQAGWNDKVEGLREIRDKLGLRFQEMAFLDADPFQRALARVVYPELIVPGLDSQPDVSVEPGDVDRFLKSLEMRLVVARFDPAEFSRIAGLTKHSRPFNLSGHVYTEEECAALLGDPAVLPLSIALGDRLGNYGLIGAIVLSPRGEEMVIRDWIMSIRMLERGVEHQLMNLVVALAQSRGCTRVTGEYIRTPRNAMVSEFFAQFGFTMIGEEPHHTLWVLPLSAYEPFPAFIQVTGDPETIV